MSRLSLKYDIWSDMSFKFSCSINSCQFVPLSLPLWRYGNTPCKLKDRNIATLCFYFQDGFTNTGNFILWIDLKTFKKLEKRTVKKMRKIHQHTWSQTPQNLKTLINCLHFRFWYGWVRRVPTEHPRLLHVPHPHQTGGRQDHSDTSGHFHDIVAGLVALATGMATHATSPLFVTKEIIDCLGGKFDWSCWVLKNMFYTFLPHTPTRVPSKIVDSTSVS